MADYQDLLDQARKVGEAIAAHPRVKTFLAAQSAVQNDAEAIRLLKDYQATADRLHTLEMEGKPIEPDDKRKLSDCERNMASNQPLKMMMRAQADYIELMNAVNDAMSEPVARSQQARPAQGS